jgi:hypothetical protein
LNEHEESAVDRRFLLLCAMSSRASRVSVLLAGPVAGRENGPRSSALSSPAIMRFSEAVDSDAR